MSRIRVVDDDPMICMAIDTYLVRHGFQVTIADGGESGLRALDDATFDLMVVDIFMPHMRGFESIRVFHERAPSIPLIAMSGYAFANIDAPAPTFPEWRSSGGHLHHDRPFDQFQAGMDAFRQTGEVRHHRAVCPDHRILPLPRYLWHFA